RSCSTKLSAMNRSGIAVVAVVAAGVFGGCSAVREMTNRGGDTSCKDFNSHDEEKQKSEVSKMLKDQNGEQASHLQISATRVAVEAYCKTIGTDDSKISDATF